MSDFWKTIPLLAALAAAAPLAAQTDGEAATDADATPPAQTQPAETGEAPATDDADQTAPSGLNMGQEIPTEETAQPGQSYVAESFGDWEQRCIRTEDGKDPCQLYQLLRDGNGNAVSEMSVFALPEGAQAAAGSTIITPLETYLPGALTISVDSGAAKRYPFDFCAQQGCFARVGFTEAEVLAFKRGAKAQMVIVPAAAPDQKITLPISLNGFTAGYDAVAAANAD
ncbi:hypothetical protein OCGS_2224 [Oceaniovalibus guishaninsula JLT2003]|uniref:Invasion associated family protein n=1 Tax=Oceaniovalibus guishaninsula JLT2003 TaxID=1231392 RepID=K2HA35_9RHOB|nr:invasion associated locus B family protein [Oceaniovalibus guishaninsula]EKE43492.1 hypothetical protein OCGS_2224 [Oceaniovalibus guishaninsula JLT2003]